MKRTKGSLKTISSESTKNAPIKQIEKKVLSENSISFKEKENYISLKLGLKVKYRALDYAKALVKSGEYTYEEAMSHIYDLQTQQQFFSNTRKKQETQHLVTDEEFQELWELFLRRCREQGCIRDISFIEMVSDLNKKKNAELHYRNKAPVAEKVESIRLVNGKGKLTFDPKQRKENRVQEVMRELVKEWDQKGYIMQNPDYYTISTAREIATKQVAKEKLNNIYEDEEDRKMAQQIYNMNNYEKQRQKEADEGKVQHEKPGRPAKKEEEKLDKSTVNTRHYHKKKVSNALGSLREIHGDDDATKELLRVIEDAMKKL